MTRPSIDRRTMLRIGVGAAFAPLIFPGNVRAQTATPMKIGVVGSGRLGGAVGALFAKAIGKDPAEQIRNDLKRLKMRLEAGVIASTQGQPSGGSLTHGERAEEDRRHELVSTASEASFPASDAPAYSH